MFFNYLATESFWNSALFIGGVWFGVLRAYTIYHFNRSLLLLITLTTLGLPFVFYLLVHWGGLTAFASFQMKYAALLGFAISTIFAEFTMMFFVPRSIRARAQARARQPLAAPTEISIAPYEAVITPSAMPPVAPQARLKPIEPQPMQPVMPLEIKPVVSPPVVQPKVRLEAPPPAHRPEPVYHPEPVRKPETGTRVALKSWEESSDTGFHVGNWRLFVYFLIFLIIVLFPPYHETVTNSRTWLFITSTSSRPFFSFYATILL
jgi:hypothetical protein